MVDCQCPGAGLGKCAIQLSELAVQLAAAGNEILRRVDLLLDQLGGAVKLCAQLTLGGVDRADLFVCLRGACVQFALDRVLMVDVHLILGQPQPQRVQHRADIIAVCPAAVQPTGAGQGSGRCTVGHHMAALGAVQQADKRIFEFVVFLEG